MLINMTILMVLAGERHEADEAGLFRTLQDMGPRATTLVALAWSRFCVGTIPHEHP